MNWKTSEGSSGRLLQYALGYFASYVVYGTAVKYFQGAADQGFPGLNQMQWLVYSTAGSTLVAFLVCVARRWYRLDSDHIVQWGPLRFPFEWLYIVPSGVMTAIIIPATTLMYSLPITVMLAMVIMRGAVIIISRIVDAIQIHRGLLHKRVHPLENWAVLFALLAVGTTLFFAPSTHGAFDFLHSTAAMGILGAYIVAYGLRIYIMNYYRNTRDPRVPMNDKGFFAVEQMAAFTTLVVVTAVLLALRLTPGATGLAGAVGQIQAAIRTPDAEWGKAVVAGLPYGIVAFFSVFLFIFKGRTATFSGLVNRLTSLVAGTTSTLLFWILFHGKAPAREDWASLGFILIAVGLLATAERRRAAGALKNDTPPRTTGPLPSPAQGTGISRA